MTTQERPIAVATSVGDTRNPYTIGVYAPVQDEITAQDLTVIGEIPADLNGVYLRNGPNRQFDAAGRYHLFDGDGMIHAVHFENGKARYRNRYVRTEAFAAESVAGKALWTGLMENPKDNPFGNTHGLGIKDSANTDVIYHRGQVLATWYLCGTPIGLDPLSLESYGAQNFMDTFHGDMMAHLKVDELTGELMWFDYGPRAPYLRYGVIGADGRQTHVTDIDLPGPRLPHDMAITAHYSILMDLPLVQDQEARAAGKYRIFYDRSLVSRFAVIPRHGGGEQVRWFEAKPCYIYHVVNSWEVGDEIVMDVCRVKNPQHQTTFTNPLSNMLAYMRLDAQLYRYRFNLRTGQTLETDLDDDNIEFPSVDARIMGQAHRYSYSMRLADQPTLLFDGLVRYDSQEDVKQEHFFGPGRWGSEAPFAPRDGSTGETDGYLVSFVTDEAAGTAEVDIFDASDITVGPIARVMLPQRIPSGFHATWVRADQLRQDGNPPACVMLDAYVYDVVRTPRGRVRRGGGTLAGVPPFELVGQLLQALDTRLGFARRQVDVQEVILGVSTASHEQGADVARASVIWAGWPDTVSGAVLSRLCCSGLDALAAAAAQVSSGQADVVLGGGVESMSRVPMLADQAAIAFDEELGERTGFVTIGVSADLTAHVVGVTREQADAYALQSHQRAAAAWAAGHYDRSVVPVRGADGQVLLAADEGIRASMTAEDFAAMPLPFAGDAAARARVGRRLPEMDGFAAVHSAATAPQMVDAASLAVIGNRDAEKLLGVAPRARILSASTGAVRSPLLNGTVVSTGRALAAAKLTAADIDIVEANESFSVSPLLVMGEFGFDPGIVNVDGGAVAMGHPLGASGGILLATALEALERTGGRYGLLTIPAALGLATSIVIERLEN